MSANRRILTGVAVWVVLVTALHFAWNVNWSVITNDLVPLDKRKLNVAYIPVT
ncbi:MAG TPA: hypothetical protein VMT00_09820 [Thermoanaerobaculia bacterium]|nr:hypothetical protein [Thermoanaerobaculia bacterium]